MLQPSYRLEIAGFVNVKGDYDVIIQTLTASRTIGTEAWKSDDEFFWNMVVNWSAPAIDCGVITAF